MILQYGYEVRDEYANLDFGHNEKRDGPTDGSYRVALPDGRILTVTYRVEDAYSGFVADVQVKLNT